MDEQARGQQTAEMAALAATRGGVDEQTRRRGRAHAAPLLSPLCEIVGRHSRDFLGRGERGIFGFPLDSYPNWVSGLGTPLEADFFLQSSPHDPYLGLGAVMGILLEIELEPQFTYHKRTDRGSFSLRVLPQGLSIRGSEAN